MYNKKLQKDLYQLSKHLLTEPNAETLGKAKQQIEGISKVIVYHEWRYYVLNEPVISDFEYDQLFKKLEALEAKFPQLVEPSSPTQRVSSDLTEDFPSVDHLTPMLSLENSYDIEDLNDFDRRVKDKTNQEPDAQINYCVEPKFDGGTIAIVYENDQLVRAATRGNGAQGEEMTNNAKAMRSIPMKAAFSKYGIQKVELRGEVIIRIETFDKVNKKREAEKKSILANPRNAATGAMRVKDPKEVEKRGLEAFMYQLGYAVDKDGNDILGQFNTHDETIQMLESLGFKVPKTDYDRKVCKDIEEVHAFCDYWQQNREAYPYEIDGMVVKVNRVDLQDLCGYTSHHPRWAIAYKFKAKQATTRLIDVEFQVGKIGSITPVAKLEPVALAGVMISSVSLHNEDFIKSKDLHYGDTVLVERAGDVIPYIVKALDELRDGSEEPIVYPSHCPINKNQEQVALVREEDEAVWKCPDCICGAQNVKRMIFHVSKDAMNIDGFGAKYIERFHEEGMLNTIADIYRIDYDKIAQLEGFGKRSAENLEAAITKAKGNPISRLLYSLSIHLVGRTVSKIFAGEVADLRDLKDWTQEQFIELHDIGPKVAENMHQFFSEPKNLALLDELESLGVNLKQLESEKKKAPILDGVFSGKTILFTGSLQQMSRKEAKVKAEEAGAKNVGSVSGNLNILVVGEKAGSKLKKAEALGSVQILTEQEFLDQLSKN